MSGISLAIVNANVVTLNPKQPKAEAILVVGGKIAAVGSNSEIRSKANCDTRTVDVKGKTVVPGLVDCHVHMTGFGHSLREVDLRDADSIGEFKRRIRRFAEEHPDKGWILGGRWDQERFAERRYPTRWDVDEAAKDVPVCVMRVCGHIGVANTKALQLAGIAKDTRIEAGSVDLDKATGEPNGILRENALEPVWRIVQKRAGNELEESCLVACHKAVEAGLTCVHWMVTSAAEIKSIQRLNAKGEIPLRIRLGVDVGLMDKWASLGLLSSSGDDIVKFGFVKILADGSLGARTAALEEPYTDKPDTRGMMLYTQKELNKLVRKAHAAGLQLAVHAIGDRGIESVLKAYEKALEEIPRRDHRHRIEHCSVLNPKLIRRMKHSSLMASVQPHFIVSDFWAENRVGKARARSMFPFKTLMREDVVVASGSDCPVENISPILGIWAAAARKSIPEESLTVEEALTSYTANAAYASFDEDKRGTVEIGKLADFTVLSDDLFNMPPDKIKDVAVEMTIVDGKIVYARKPFHP